MQDTHLIESLKINSYPQSFGHTVFIDEHIAESTYYRSVLSLLASAQESDTIRFVIDSHGGFGSTAMVLAHAMDQCKACKVGVISGNCQSAATIIALHCDEWEVGYGADWLAHTASFGVGGEAHKVAKQHEHEQKIIRELLFREYQGFYNEDEIEDIASGNDSLLTYKDILERLQKYSEYRNSKAEEYHQEIEDMMWEENTRIIDETVKKLPFSDEEKAVFNKVRKALDEALEEDVPTEGIEEEHTCCGGCDDCTCDELSGVIEEAFAQLEESSQSEEASETPEREKLSLNKS